VSYLKRYENVIKNSQELKNNEFYFFSWLIS